MTDKNLTPETPEADILAMPAKDAPPAADTTAEMEQASKMLLELEQKVLQQYQEELNALNAKHNVVLHPVFMGDVNHDGEYQFKKFIKAVWGGPKRA